MFFYSPADGPFVGYLRCITEQPSISSKTDYSWYQPIDPFPEPPLDHPYFGHPYTGHEVFSTTIVPSNDTLRYIPPAPTGLPASIAPGSTASLGDPSLLHPLQGIDQVNIRSGSAQFNDFDDMVETPFLGGAHVNAETRPTTSSALHSVPVDKPDEADDKITFADIDRLLGNHDRVCICLNCLDYPHLLYTLKLRDQFPALRQITCRVGDCTWKSEPRYHDYIDFWYMTLHEESHFRAETRDLDGKWI